jgi:hypothetical protein
MKRGDPCEKTQVSRHSYGLIIGYKSNDLHLIASFRTDRRVDLVDFPDHGRPALGRDGLPILLAHPRNQRGDARFPHLPP